MSPPRTKASSRLETRAKRQRVDSDAKLDTGTREEPWYTDGNLIIQVIGHQFRVHCSIICENSVALKEMLDKQKDDNISLSDGCLLLHLEDSFENVKFLIKACYHQRLITGLEPPSLSLLSSMLRVGKKYQITTLYEEAIHRLTAEFPSSLESVENMKNWIFLKKPQTEQEMKEFYVDAVNLISDTGTLTALPLALCLLLHHLSVEEQLLGVPRRDGTIAHLTKQNQINSILGLEALRKAQYNHTFGWLKIKQFPTTSCHSQEKCRRFQIEMTTEYASPAPTIHGLLDWDDRWDKKICNTCRLIAKDACEKGRRHIWDHLPSYFRLPEWENLHNT